MSEKQTLPPEVKSKQRAAPPEKMVPKGKPETPDIPGSPRDSPRNPRLIRETENQDWLKISRILKDTIFNVFKSTIISQRLKNKNSKLLTAFSPIIAKNFPHGP